MLMMLVEKQSTFHIDCIISQSTSGVPVTSRKDWMTTKNRLVTLERQMTTRNRLDQGH